MIEALDAFSRRFAKVGDDVETLIKWHRDKRFLMWMGPLCICTNTMTLVVFSLLGQVEAFLYIVVIAGNMFWGWLMLWKVLEFEKIQTKSSAR